MQPDRPWLQHYPPNMRSTLEYPAMTLPDLLTEAAQKYPERPATIFFNRRRSYREVFEMARRVAAGLTRLGLRKGDRVAVILPNCPQVVAAYFGIMMAGGIVVMHNPLYTERELEHQLRDSGAEVVIVLDLLLGRLLKVRERTSLRHVIVTGIQDELPFPLNFLYPLKVRREGHRVSIPTEPWVSRWREFMQGGGEPSAVAVQPEDVALLQYTGGTTGTSKGAILTHRNMVCNVYQSLEPLRGEYRPGEETILAALPFFHVYGMTVCMNMGVAIGAGLILMPRFEVTAVLKAIDRYRPALFPGAPTMYVAVNHHPDAAKYDLRSVKACLSGAAPLPVEVQERFEALTGGKLVEGYGLTEASPVTHVGPLYGARKIGTIGLPVPDTDCKIVDLETGERELGVGEVGELCIRGPQVMQGYWNRPEETAMALRDGWLYTGDIAAMDEDGFFKIVDRKKDMIIAGGFNIYPREVEEVLFEHPKIQEAAVAGVPDEYRGETVKAYVVLKPGETATAEEIIAFCRERLASFKAPRLVEFRSELPKTLVGKVLRRMLIEEEKKKLSERQKPA